MSFASRFALASAVLLAAASAAGAQTVPDHVTLGDDHVDHATVPSLNLYGGTFQLIQECVDGTCVTHANTQCGSFAAEIYDQAYPELEGEVNER